MADECGTRWPPVALHIPDARPMRRQHVWDCAEGWSPSRSDSSGLGHALPFSAPELASSNRLSFEACGLPDTAGGGEGAPSRLPSYPSRRPQPRRRLVRRDRRGTVSALGAELSPTCRAGIALVVTLGGILAVDTHDGPSGYRCCSIGHDPAVKVCRSFTETRSPLRSGSSP